MEYYYNDFRTDHLNDMHFNAGVLTENMFEEFQKNPHFLNFLYATTPIIHTAATPGHERYITMLEFDKDGGYVADYDFAKCFEHAAAVLNPYTNAPLHGTIFRTGEKIGDVEKYTIHENGTVTSEKVTSIPPIA